MVMFNLHQIRIPDDQPRKRCEFARCSHKARWRVWTPHCEAVACNQHHNNLAFMTYRKEILLQMKYVAERIDLHVAIVAADGINDLSHVHEMTEMMERGLAQWKELATMAETITTLSGGSVNL